MPADGPEAERLLNPGWRALIGFWVVVLALLAGGGGVLAWLGPPDGMAHGVAAPAPPPPAAVAPRPAAAAAPGPVAAAPAEPPAIQVAAAAPRPVPPVASAAVEPVPAMPPPAPEPPPLPAAIPRGPPQPSRPIPAADPALLEAGPYGDLPRISGEGRTAIRTYGRAFDRQDPRSKLGLIIGGLGMNAAVSENAIRRLPGAVTLAFSPYAPQLPLLLDQARAKGMELLVALPLEPTGYPLNNPGDQALLTGQTEALNQDRLDWALSRFTGYVGAIGALGPMRGERFAALSDRHAMLQDALRRRGLLYVDPRPGARAPERVWGRAIDLVVDEPATRGEIELKLAALERLAQERGAALGYAGEASPVVVDRIAAWAGSVEARGFVLAPVSALRAPAVATSDSAVQPVRSGVR
jgi:polysaccharide deacetylase 2 family uncharacterized protein YibQ